MHDAPCTGRRRVRPFGRPPSTPRPGGSRRHGPSARPACDRDTPSWRARRRRQASQPPTPTTHRPSSAAGPQSRLRTSPASRSRAARGERPRQSRVLTRARRGRAGSTALGPGPERTGSATRRTRSTDGPELHRRVPSWIVCVQGFDPARAPGPCFGSRRSRRRTAALLPSTARGHPAARARTRRGRTRHWACAVVVATVWDAALVEPVALASLSDLEVCARPGGIHSECKQVSDRRHLTARP